MAQLRKGSTIGGYPILHQGSPLIGATASITGAISAASASLTGALSAESVSLTGALSAGSVSLTGALSYNDVSRYWLSTATNWGIYWNTTDNKIEFHGSGTNRAWIDLDNGDANFAGNLTVGGDVTFSKNVGTINFGNGNLNNINSLEFADPGPDEGIKWAGGNAWKIYESPDDLTTNSGGNLQVVQNTTRRASFRADGGFNLPGYVRMGHVSTSTGRAPFNPIWAAVRMGKKLFTDEDFSAGTGSVISYSGSTVTRIDMADAPNSSKKVLEIRNTATSSPGHSGFVQTYSSAAGRTIVQIFRAKIPVGYKVIDAANGRGTGGFCYWLSNQDGTGEWEEYIRVTHSGSGGGTFSTAGHVYLTGSPAPTAGAPLVWYLATCTAYDVTDFTGFNTESLLVNGTTIVDGNRAATFSKVTVGTAQMVMQPDLGPSGTEDTRAALIFRNNTAAPDFIIHDDVTNTFYFYSDTAIPSGATALNGNSALNAGAVDLTGNFTMSKDAPNLKLINTVTANSAASGKIELLEQDTNYGAFIHYDGAANVFNIGVKDANTDYNAIQINRTTRDATFLAKITTTGITAGASTFSGLVKATGSWFEADRPAGTDWMLVGRVTGASSAQFAASVLGVLEWGDGTAARDTTLYRSAANTLKTDDAVIVGLDLTVSGAINMPATTPSFKSDTAFGFFTTGSAAQQIRAGSALVSNSYSDASNVPTNGIWSKGTIKGASIVESTYDNSSHATGAFYASGSASWYMLDFGIRGASTGRFGIGLTATEADRIMSFHVPNHAAYSSTGAVPKFAWYSNGSVQLATLQSASGDFWTKGNITVGSTSDTTDTVINVLSGDTKSAGVNAYGSDQGTGYFYAGQSGTHGGGFMYNGDGTPAFATGEVADAVSFYRRTGGVNEVVFYYLHNSNTTTFRGTINLASGGVNIAGAGAIDSSRNFNPATYVSLDAADGNRLRFWNSDSYAIWMSAAGHATWGGRLDTTSDYNMYFRMTGGTNRGFLFHGGSAGTTPLFQITPDKVYSAEPVQVGLTAGSYATLDETGLTFNNATQADLRIQRNGENLEFIEPEDTSKLWMRYTDDLGLYVLGYVNASSTIQTNGTTRIDASGNLLSIGTIGLSGDVTFTNAADRSVTVAATAVATAGRKLILDAGNTAADGTARSHSGGNLDLRSGQSVGTGTSRIEFWTPTPAGGAGTTLNALASRGWIDNTGLTLAGNATINSPSGYIDLRANQSSYNNGIILRQSYSSTSAWANIGMSSGTELFLGVLSASTGVKINSSGDLTATRNIAATGSVTAGNIKRGTVTIPAGSTSVTWTHSYNGTNYTVSLTPNSPSRHVYYSSKAANTIVVNIDDSDAAAIDVDCLLIGA